MRLNKYLAQSGECSRRQADKNVLDGMVTVNGILGTSELSDIEFQLADMNGDGVLNILDVILIANEALN